MSPRDIQKARYIALKRFLITHTPEEYAVVARAIDAFIIEMQNVVMPEMVCTGLLELTVSDHDSSLRLYGQEVEWEEYRSGLCTYEDTDSTEDKL